MFAVIQVGSIQYKVSEGDKIETQLVEGSPKKDIELDKVLLYCDGADVKVGQPFLSNVKVKAKILSQHRGEKTIAYKYRRRKNDHWKKGHRQSLMMLSITKIAAQ